jgi:hypothetical protein
MLYFFQKYVVGASDFFQTPQHIYSALFIKFKVGASDFYQTPQHQLYSQCFYR